MNEERPPATCYVGIDIGARQHQAAVASVRLMEKGNAAWRKAPQLRFTNRRPDFLALRASIRAQETDPTLVLVAVDYTGGHYSAPLVHFLMSEGYGVYHLEPKAAHVIKRGLLDEENKTDKVDACTIAHLLYLRDRLGEPIRVAPVRADLTSQAAGVRAAVLQRWAVNKGSTQAMNRLHQYLTAVFPEGERQHFQDLAALARWFPPTPERILALEREGNPDALPLPVARWKAIVEAAAISVGVPGAPYEAVLTRAGEDLARAQQQKALLDDDIKAVVQAHPYGPILLSFPYVGATAAAVIISVVEDVSRFPTKKHFRKALGVYSTARQTGEGPHLGKNGEGGQPGREARPLPGHDGRRH